jgi:hypothetical protein
MRATDFLPYVALTAAAVFFVQAIVSSSWPERIKRGFRASMAALFFFAIGIYWLATGEKPDETLYRFALCPFVQLDGCKPKKEVDRPPPPHRTPDVSTRSTDRNAVPSPAAPAPIPKATAEKQPPDQVPTVAPEPSQPKPDGGREPATNLSTLLTTTWKRVCTSARSAEEARRLIESAEPKPWVNNVVLQLVPEWSQAPICHKVTAPISGESFGQIKDHSFDEMMAMAASRGAMECPWELSIALRLAIPEMKPDEGFILAARPLVRPNHPDTRWRLPSLGNGKSYGNNLPEGNWLTNLMGADTASTYRSFVFCIRP